jgi:hypothetical protein
MRKRQQRNNKGHCILTLLLIFCLVATNLNVGFIIQNVYGSSLENLEVASEDAENADSQDFNNGGGVI